MEPLRSNSANPYVGLQAFETRHADLFKGRDALIQLGLQKLKSKAQSSRPFLLLLGKDGAGKSSLLQAGILTHIQGCYLFPDTPRFHCGEILTADLSIDPVKGLVYGLAQLNEYPLIQTTEIDSVIHLCRNSPEQFFSFINQRKAQLPKSENALLSIAQFERLFFSKQVTLAELRLFIELIVGLVSQCQVFVVASLRSDFYQSLSDFPALLWLKQNGGQLDVLPPTVEQLVEMIRLPNSEFDLRFEEGKEQHPSLDVYLAKRAAEFPNSLPLLQFILKNLFEHRSQNGLMNFSSYRNLGGIERVIAKVTENTYQGLDRSVKKYFSRIMNHLVERSERGRYERLWVHESDLYNNDRSRQLVDAFYAIGILTKQKNCKNEVFIALAHDCLFEHWPRLSETLESHQAILTLKNILEAQAKQWKGATRSSAYLLSSGRALDEGKLLLKQGRASLSSDLRKLINASIKRQKLKYRLWVTAGLIVLGLFAFALNNAYQAKVQANIAKQKLSDSQELIEFLIADESQQLQTIGRLDLMQQGSEKSFEYLSKVEPRDDSTAAKLSRSQTFMRIAQVYLENKHYDDALQAFEASLALDNELVEIHPNGFSYWLELAQAQYWIAKTYLTAGKTEKALEYFQHYQASAFGLVELQPDSAAARMELSKAYYNMGLIAIDKGQLESATQLFFESVKFAEKGKSAADIDGLIATANAYRWLADKYHNDLKVAEALEMRMGEKRLRASISKRSPNNRNRIEAAIASWNLSTKQLMMGQYNQAFETLTMLYESTQKLAEDDYQVSYLRAFSLGRLGQVALQRGDTERAKNYFHQSLQEFDNDQQIAAPLWADAFFERQYWIARSHLEQNNMAAFNASGYSIENATHAAAKTWKIRLANLTKQQTDWQAVADTQSIDPAELVAYIEYVSIHEKIDELQILWDRVPQEMWLNGDMELLRPIIRKQLRSEAEN
ncbi:tetratricopeptide repeat protein [Aliiglaciecola sp. LCG003]|uniref:nSTAND1 domain-containing NTPase n=1 Tax=Aliiglaciecola sp. LCG003 TaxID=3053655 RepID=UPI002573046B|nr:tetratricopeptide repeat protein [Aliiglaciecola sp. LCG003]WJG09770.1 tetratricopeptide repeat protein [Aliiglaciecola sp. LCG003]